MGKRQRKAGAARRRARVDYTSRPAGRRPRNLLHILERVPDVPDLFRCAASCRRWLRLVAGSARRRQPAPFVAGLFHQMEGYWYKKPAADRFPPQFLRLDAMRRPACLTALPLGSLVSPTTTPTMTPGSSAALGPWRRGTASSSCSSPVCHSPIRFSRSTTLSPAAARGAFLPLRCTSAAASS